MGLGTMQPRVRWEWALLPDPGSLRVQGLRRGVVEGMARGLLGTGGLETKMAVVLHGAGQGHLVVSRGAPREPGRKQNPGMHPEPGVISALGKEGDLGAL